ncbi:MAG: GlsB/YeaQ/YmgE family stress response membrane protein [Thermoleophilia bacterium]
MGIIAFLLLGLIAGAIAKAIMPGEDPGGILVTMVIGVAGALVGGFLAAVLFDAHPLDHFFDISTWLTAIVGSVILLGVYRMATGRRLRT